MANSLEQLKRTGTNVCCDSAEFILFDKYTPQGATTNPSLILAASDKPEYAKLLDLAAEYGIHHEGCLDEKVDSAYDYVLVQFGKEITKIVPGRVSTELDATLSFDKDASIRKALQIVRLYENQGVPKDRVFVKIATTWEGLQAARVLERDHGIRCNMTLVFSLIQAIAAAEAGASVVSPFVGRILDWHKKMTKDFSPVEDPGVRCVQNIYNYYKHHGYKTAVMAASFRNQDEIAALAGCDYLTIGTSLLEQLQRSKQEMPRKLYPSQADPLGIPDKSYLNNESGFRSALNEDRMASENLRTGISRFVTDTESLKRVLHEKITAS